MDERRTHKILITVLVGLFLIIAGLVAAIIFVNQEPSYFALGTFEEKIEKADEIIGSIFYSDNNEYDLQKFIFVDNTEICLCLVNR